MAKGNGGTRAGSSSNASGVGGSGVIDSIVTSAKSITSTAANEINSFVERAKAIRDNFMNNPIAPDGKASTIKKIIKLTETTEKEFDGILDRLDTKKMARSDEYVSLLSSIPPQTERSVGISTSKILNQEMNKTASVLREAIDTVKALKKETSNRKF